MKRHMFLVVVTGFFAAHPTCLFATWILGIVDKGTGKLAIAGETCLTDFDRLAGSPVITTGQRLALIRGFGDGKRRPVLFNGLAKDTAPQEILTSLQALESHDLHSTPSSIRRDVPRCSPAARASRHTRTVWQEKLAISPA